LNLLDDTVKVTAFRSLLKGFKQFFIPQGQMRTVRTSRVWWWQWTSGTIRKNGNYS